MILPSIIKASVQNELLDLEKYIKKLENAIYQKNANPSHLLIHVNNIKAIEQEFYEKKSLPVEIQV